MTPRPGRAAGRDAAEPTAGQWSVVPASGRPGRDAGRAWLPLRLPAHRASSATLAGAYPLLAGPPAPAGGPFLGQDAFSGRPFCFDPWAWYAAGALTNPNVVLAGVIGQGKSALAKSLAVRSLPWGRRVYVPGDPKGEWAPAARLVGGTVLDLGPGLPTRLNPLDPGPRPADQPAGAWAAVVAGRRRQLLTGLAATVLGRALRPAEHTVLDLALTAAERAAAKAGRAPTLPDVATALHTPAAEPARPAAHGLAMSPEVLAAEASDLAHALRRLVRGDLAGLFDAPSTVVVDPRSPMVVLDLSRLGGDDTALPLAMSCASAWLDAQLAAGTGPRWVVYDEAWRLLRSPALVARMQTQWKLARAHGLANLMVIHRLSDLDAVGDARSEARALAVGLLADCATRIVYRQETDQLGPAARALGLSEPERDLVVHLPRGSGLWKTPAGSFVVHHRLHAEEAAAYDTDTAMTTNPQEFVSADVDRDGGRGWSR